MKEQNDYKGENYNEDMSKRSKRRRKHSFIDGVGLILLIIGIALILLRQDIKIFGLIITLVGFIRIIYTLAKYG